MARFRGTGLALAAALVAAPALAQGDAAAAPGPQARAGELLLLQLWADDDQQFLKEWSQPTPPRLSTSTSTVRNDPITMFIVFGGCKADSAGNCRLTGKVEFTDPDGLPYGPGHEFRAWETRAPANSKLLMLSPASIGMIIEDGEKLGEYRVRLSVTDEVAGVTAVTEEELTVSEAPAD